MEQITLKQPFKYSATDTFCFCFFYSYYLLQNVKKAITNSFLMEKLFGSLFFGELL